LITGLAEPHDVDAVPAPGKHFDAVPAPAPTLLKPSQGDASIFYLGKNAQYSNCVIFNLYEANVVFGALERAHFSSDITSKIN
jgi:hypothetical protein